AQGNLLKKRRVPRIRLFRAVRSLDVAFEKQAVSDRVKLHEVAFQMILKNRVGDPAAEKIFQTRLKFPGVGHKLHIPRLGAVNVSPFEPKTAVYFNIPPQVTVGVTAGQVDQQAFWEGKGV